MPRASLQRRARRQPLCGPLPFDRPDGWAGGAGARGTAAARGAAACCGCVIGLSAPLAASTTDRPSQPCMYRCKRAARGCGIAAAFASADVRRGWRLAALARPRPGRVRSARGIGCHCGGQRRCGAPCVRTRDCPLDLRSSLARVLAPHRAAGVFAISGAVLTGDCPMQARTSATAR